MRKILIKRWHNLTFIKKAERFFIRFILFIIACYKILISPFLPTTCRFHPTCSSYCKEAVEKYGIFGLFLAVKRLFRCHPWHPGGFDPVP